MELKENNKEIYGFKVDVKDQDNGTYLVEYTNGRHLSLAHFLGLFPSFGYTLSMCLRGAHIKGSPFVVKPGRA